METKEHDFIIINRNNIFGVLIKPPNSLFLYLSFYYQYGYNSDYQVTYKICLN